MSTGWSKNYNRVKAPQHHYITMAKHNSNSNACLCLYPSNSSVQQPDSEVNNGWMCRLSTWTTAFNQGRHWWVVGGGWSNCNRCTVCPWDNPNPRFVAQNCGISLWSFEYLWEFCWTQGCLPDCMSVQLHARYSVRSESSAVRYRPSERLHVNLAQKISNRTDCPILVRQEAQLSQRDRAWLRVILLSHSRSLKIIRNDAVE